MNAALIKLTPAIVVRTVFPFADDDEVQYLLWEHTGWPAFWCGNALAEIRESLLTYKRTLESGQRCCSLCNDPATVKGYCAECHTAMVAALEGTRKLRGPLVDQV